MDDPERIDRIRDWVEGKLSAAESARLEQELAGDPALRQFAAEYREVHVLTAAAAAAASRGTSKVSFSSLERSEPGLRPRSPLWRVAAAAAVVLALWGWRWMSLRELRETAVQLSTLVPVADPLPWEEPPAVASLADYVPVEGREIHWIRDLDDARDMARATLRPLFVFGVYPDCPLAQSIRDNALSDDAVISLTESFIPVEVDLLSMDEKTRTRLEEGGYPVLEVQDQTGQPLRNFSETYDVHEFYRQLEQGLMESDSDPIDWNLSRELAALHEEARHWEEQGQWARAYEDYTFLDEYAGQGTFKELAQRGLERVAAAASDTVLEAQARSQTDARQGIEFLQSRIADFRGTPYAQDLSRLLEQTQRLQRFPEFAWAASPRD